MAWSVDQIICIKHPKEIPQPGVCPSCLRERLSRIAGGGGQNSRTSTTLGSSASFCSSSESISSSPRTMKSSRVHHQRVASDAFDSLYLAIKGYDLGLKKSRSVAFDSAGDDVDHGTARGYRGALHHGNNSKSKKKTIKRFWDRVMLRSSARKIKI